MLKNVDTLRSETDELNGNLEVNDGNSGEVVSTSGRDSVDVGERGETVEERPADNDAEGGTEGAVSDQLPAPAQDPSDDRRQQQQGDSASQAERSAIRRQRSVEFINGSKVYLGELVPFKGVLFQVIHIKNQTIAMTAIDLTSGEKKRLAGSKGKGRR